MDVALGPGLFASDADLVNNFLRVALRRPVGLASFTEGLGYINTGPDVAVLWVLCVPPLQQDRKALVARGYGPIKLRGQIIQPGIGDPFAGIGVDFCVSVITLDLRGRAGTPYPEGADAEFD